MKATILSYLVDPPNDCVHATLLLENGSKESFVFRESEYLSSPNWTGDDLCAAVVKAHGDATEATLAVTLSTINAQGAQSKLTSDATLASAKAESEKTLATIAAPSSLTPTDVTGAATAVGQAEQHLQKMQEVHRDLSHAKMMADQADKDRETQLAAARAKAEKDAEFDRIVSAVVAKLQVPLIPASA